MRLTSGGRIAAPGPNRMSSNYITSNRPDKGAGGEEPTLYTLQF